MKSLPPLRSPAHPFSLSSYFHLLQYTKYEAPLSTHITDKSTTRAHSFSSWTLTLAKAAMKDSTVSCCRMSFMSMSPASTHISSSLVSISLCSLALSGDGLFSPSSNCEQNTTVNRSSELYEGRSWEVRESDGIQIPTNSSVRSPGGGAGWKIVFLSLRVNSCVWPPFVCTARTQICAHVKDPRSISRKRVGFTCENTKTLHTRKN